MARLHMQQGTDTAETVSWQNAYHNPVVDMALCMHACSLCELLSQQGPGAPPRMGLNV